MMKRLALELDSDDTAYPPEPRQVIELSASKDHADFLEGRGGPEAERAAFTKNLVNPIAGLVRDRDSYIRPAD